MTVKRSAIAILILLLLLLQYKLWLGSGNLIEVSRLKDAIAAQKQENAMLQERNRALEAEVEDLKKGQAAVEERARKELGMVKKGESFYQIVDENQLKPLPYAHEKSEAKEKPLAGEKPLASEKPLAGEKPLANEKPLAGVAKEKPLAGKKPLANKSTRESNVDLTHQSLQSQQPKR